MRSESGQVLNWVCRDNLSYLDLTQNRLENCNGCGDELGSLFNGVRWIRINAESHITGMQSVYVLSPYGIRNTKRKFKYGE